MAPPNHCMVWYVRVGSTTTVGAVLGAVEKSTVPRSLSLSAPSAVVIQTWAEAAGGAGAAAAVAAVAPSPPAPAAPTTRAPAASRQADRPAHSLRGLGGRE